MDRAPGILPGPPARHWLTTCRLVLPLACRRLRRQRWQAVLTGAIMAAAVATYLLLGAQATGTTQRLVAAVGPVPLAADVLALAPDRLPDDIESRLHRVVDLDRWEYLEVAEVYTLGGRLLALGLGPGSEFYSRLTLVAGSWPAAPAGPSGEVEAAFPAGLPGVVPGTATVLLQPGPGGWRELAVRVSGLYQSLGSLANGPLLHATALERLTGRGANGVAGYLTAGGSLERASSRLQQLFWDGTTVTSASGRQLAHTLGRAALSPVRTVAGMVALFAAAGVFALLLLSFLKHKRYFGILKALGMESSEVGLLLVLEGLLVAVSGTGCGWIIALVLVRVVNRHTALPLVLRAELFAASLVLAAGAFLVASWVPVALTRRATVDQLLHNRRVYLDPNPSCAQCGRCGGF